MIYTCCDSSRRAVLAQQSVYNGIDYLEVDDNPAEPMDQRQRTLWVHFFHPLAAGQLTLKNVIISGGERITNVHAVAVTVGASASPATDPKILTVTVNGPGDFSRYTLSLVDPNAQAQPPPFFDPIYSSIDFSFKVACPSTLDCQPSTVCPPTPLSQPAFSYLAKDYATFRSLMLDRMAAILPAWQERNPADLGIVLVELLAFLGDYLSYQQDTVATEACLGTARRRTSVRRHARLVDYPMHDGRNARTWIHFEASSAGDGAVIKTYASSKNLTQFLTQGSQPAFFLPMDTTEYQQALAESPQVFELMEDLTLYSAHNSMSFYTWGDQRCCLPAGATEAWLLGSFPHLKAGMVLILVEVKGPETGAPEDANPSHRCAVRLTSVQPDSDPIGGLFNSPSSAGPTPLTKIQWGALDALPFAVCISSRDSEDATTSINDVSVAFGNNALADHGRTILGEKLAIVPAPNPALTLTLSGGCDRCNPSPPSPKPVRYNPSLSSEPLTFADSYTPAGDANSALNSRTVDDLLPAIELTESDSKETWEPQRDLLKSQPDFREFVAEVENDGSASLRFGDGVFGLAPPPGTQFLARYRVGNGTAGNVGPDSLCRVASNDPVLVSGSGAILTEITNPLPASGGIDLETNDQVRASAPYAFRTQDRAVTVDDYGTMALRVDPMLQQARGTFRWTGSWQTVFIAADPKGTNVLSAARAANLKNGMELYRMAGHDVDVDSPVYVSLFIAMRICVKSGYLSSHVEQSILDVLSNRVLPDGTLGLFHPDRLTFGQTIYLSPIYAAVQAVAGVDSVVVRRFERQGHRGDDALSAGYFQLDRLEIARLDNDRNFPERGRLALHMHGGE